MNKGDLKIERLQQYLDRQKGVVESNIKEYNPVSYTHLTLPTILRV